MTLDNLIGKGLLHEPTSATEIRRFLAKIAIKLNDARSEQISLDTRFDIANEALQTLNKSIGYPQDGLRLLDEFRRQRAAGLYDGSFDPSDAEVQAILETVTDLKRHLEGWLRVRHPELL